MEAIGIWLSPLLLLPGAALLILSTSNRLNRLHDEVHHQIDEKHSHSKEIIDDLLVRARYFRNALVLLYSSISIFAVAGIIGGLTSGWDEISTVLTIGLTIIGIICITAAAIDNISAGIGMGVAFGVAIGMMMDKKKKKNNDDK